jgi:hypothetical protein
MAAHLLLTCHHNQALANACQRGLWLPLALDTDQAFLVSHLAVIAPGERAICAVAPITSLEPWIEADGIERWLPFLAPARTLRHPIPLGRSQALRQWLPQGPTGFQIIAIDELLAAPSLAAWLEGPSQKQAPDHGA